MVAVGDITPLWSTDLDGALLGAVDIPGSRRGFENLGMRLEDGYFNSGVLLIDLKQWRQERALHTLLAYVSENHEKLRDPDQDALNACFARQRKKLDFKWNLIRPFYRDPPVLPLPRAEIDRILSEERIIHFNGYVKPWSYFSDHPRREVYWKYLRMTEWHDFVPADQTALNTIRKIVSMYLPKGIKKRFKAAVG